MYTFARVALLLLMAVSCWSQTQLHPSLGQKPKGSFWKASVAALVAATAADAGSSIGRRELNPMLAGSDGRFGMRGIAVKGFITGGALGIQYLFLHKSLGGSKAAGIANLGMASVYSSAAAHNLTNRRAKQ
jgi:hypothetical protein